MNQFAKSDLRAAVVLAVALCGSANFAGASYSSDERALQRGAIEDVTPQQKYQTAIREAGGAYKEALRECARLTGADHRACVRDAKVTYESEMADARLILQGKARL